MTCELENKRLENEEYRYSPVNKPKSIDKVAYIMSRFPKLTETFILYEMVALEEAGIRIELFPLLREKQAVQHPEVEKFIKRAHFHPFISFKILTANWYFLLHKPRRYFRVWWEVLSGTFGSFNFFFGALGVLPKSVRFAYEMKKLNVKHIHAHFANHPAVAGMIISRLTDIPFSFTAHGSDLHVERRMLDKKIEAAAATVTVSEYNKELMVETCGEALREKIHVIHCGVDSKSFQLKTCNSHPRPFQILCVASYEEVKGHKYLVQACELLAKREVDFLCHLVGYGPLREQVERQIAGAGLSDHFKIYGPLPQSEILGMYAEADVFVLPSVLTKSGKREGIPVVLMEAMSSGIPVVSSQLSGIPELVQDGISGILVPPGDVNGIADALQRLSAEPELRVQMGKAGRIYILEHFDLQKNALKLSELFEKVS